MLKHIYTLLFILMFITCKAQDLFEEGYFIDNAAKRTTCLIKNMDWKNNPSSFQYKLSKSDEIKEGLIDEIQEFGINNTLKYHRAIVGIDRSSENSNRLDNRREANLKEEQLFLKVLLEGQATLYYYEENNLRRYFFKKGDAEIEQLIFKLYMASNKRIVENDLYKQQLWENLNCNDISINSLDDLEYKRKALVNYFIRYFECKEETFILFAPQKENRELININLRLKLNVASFSMENSISNLRDTDFDTKLSGSMGLELEYLLPYNNNNWALLIEPSYSYFKDTKEITYIETSVLSRQTEVRINYQTVEFPIGFRYYIWKNAASSYYLNAAVIFELTTANSIVAERRDLLDLVINPSNNFAFGLGYKHQNKFIIELRYRTNKELLSTYLNWNSAYKSTYLIFGYNLF